LSAERTITIPFISSPTCVCVCDDGRKQNNNYNHGHRKKSLQKHDTGKLIPFVSRPTDKLFFPSSTTNERCPQYERERERIPTCRRRRHYESKAAATSVF